MAIPFEFARLLVEEAVRASGGITPEPEDLYFRLADLGIRNIYPFLQYLQKEILSRGFTPPDSLQFITSNNTIRDVIL